MKLISVLVPGLVTIATLSLPATPTIAFSVNRPLVPLPANVDPSIDPSLRETDVKQLQARLFGNQSSINITQFDLGQIRFGYGLFQEDDFLGLGQGLVMSTGTVDRLAGVNCADGFNPNCNDPTKKGADLNANFAITAVDGTVISDPLDRVVLTILFNAKDPGQLNLKYVFGSEEYPELVPANRTDASDIFYALLYGSDDQQAFNPQPSFKQAISVASAFSSGNTFTSNLIGEPNSLKTPLDAYTKPLRASIPFKSGINRLIFGIDDRGVGGEGYDSAVFLQQISVQTDKPPSVPTPSLLFGLTWMGWRRWRDRHKSR
jgi:hypothetical protein